MPSTVQNLFIVAALMAVAIVLVLGLWNMMKGGSPNRSQSLMRLRVLLQAVAIFVVMMVIWMLGR
jgi:quinol-cytochrome oxidoreductase complex cytochrome b subunit